MSDHVAVMRDGVIDQVADGKSIYDDPATPFVASFVGENNVFRGKVKSMADGHAIVSTNRSGELRARIASSALNALSEGDDAMLFVRPESFGISADEERTDHHLTARITHEEFEGQAYNVFLEGEAGKELKMSLVNQGQARQSAEGSELTLTYDPDQGFVLPAGELAAE